MRKMIQVNGGYGITKKLIEIYEAKRRCLYPNIHKMYEDNKDVINKKEKLIIFSKKHYKYNI